MNQVANEFDEAWFEQSSRTILQADDDLSLYRVQPSMGSAAYVVAGTHWSRLEASRRLEQEFALASSLDADWACIPLAYIRGVRGPMLVFPDMATPHVVAADGSRLAICDFLDLAAGAVHALAQVHAAGLLHLGIKPAALAAPSDGRVRLRCFGESVAFTRRHRSLYRPLLADMPYCPPEQNRQDLAHIDERSDLYALGITFYELLTGTLPLQANSPEQWLHAHIAVQPVGPATLRNDIPPIVAAMILKLMSKDPRDRYQTCLGLHADLVRCRDEWSAQHHIANFELDAVDRGAILLDKQSLFGRSEDIDKLAKAFLRISEGGGSELILISGSAGAGKSALAAMLPRVVGRPLDYFGVGKCDQLRKTIPYAPLVQIIRSLTLQLLGKPQEELDRVSAALLAGLATHGSLISDLVPELEVIIGPSLPLLDLPVQSAQGRFHVALTNTLSAFASGGSPLAIVIDDLQWADPSTISYVVSFWANPPPRCLLLGTYREEEEAVIGPLRRSLALSGLADAKPEDLRLKPLSLAATTDLIATALKMQAYEVKPLCEVVFQKTAGNPFFINQLLRALIDDAILYRDPGRRMWRWDLDRLTHHPQADNVIDLLVRRLESLPDGARQLLRLMACIGSRCDGSLVQRLVDMTASQLDQQARIAIEAGLLVRYSKGYAFSHDRILEAAYALTSEAERTHEHARIANLMIEVWSERLDETAFEIATQIERAARQSLSGVQTLAFVKALVLATRRAKGAAAIEQASTYLAIASSLLGTDGWSKDYAISFEFNLLQAECCLISMDFERGSSSIDDVLWHALSPLELAQGYRLKATLQTVRSDYAGAINSALAGLGQLGIVLPRFPGAMELAQAYDAVKHALDGRPIGEIAGLPVCNDPEIEAAMSLLSTLASSFFVNDDISFLHLAKTVELTLIHGITPTCPYGLSWFGVYIAHHYSAYHDGFLYGEVALKIVERLDYEAARTATLVALDQVSPWTHTLTYAVTRAREAVATGHVRGDLGMACYACNHIVSDLLVMGEHLSLIEEDIERGLTLTRQIGYLDVQRIIAAQKRHVTRLRHGPYEPAPRHRGEVETEHSMSRPTMFWEHLYAGMSAVYFGDFDEASWWFGEAEPLAWSIPAHINLSDFHLYTALALAHGSASKQPPHEILRKLDPHRARMSAWTMLNPATFRSKLLLIEAEMARLGGDSLLALQTYELSANAAAASGFVHEEALAHELAGKLSEARGLLTAASQHQRMAWDCYRRWGADGKMRGLEAGHPSLNSHASYFEVPAAHEAQKAIDLAVGMKAAEALSRETVLDRLIERLMADMMMHAGAQYGVLLLAREGKPTVEAVGQITDGEISVSLRSCDPTADHVPPPVLNSVMRTGKLVVFDEVSVDAPSLWATSTGRRTVRSLLCLPLIKQGQLIGILHLENSLASGVFTPARTAMVEILAPQAAISLETARLYSALLLENEQHALTEASLQKARAELARTSHLTIMGGLAASIAHEINQPLSAIVSRAAAGVRWLKRGEPVVEEGLLEFGRIKQEGLRAAGIIKGLRALAKQAPANLCLISVDTVIEEVLRLTSSELEEKNISLTADLNDGSHLVFADPIQIQQVVLNLINNAVDAMVENGDEPHELSIVSEQKNDIISVSVRDNGPGLDPITKERIFDSFFTTKENGMGMGLAICQSIMEAHGGALDLEDSEPRGCIFTFRLPMTSKMRGSGEVEFVQKK